jgi:hypothetical protein
MNQRLTYIPVLDKGCDRLRVGRSVDFDLKKASLVKFFVAREKEDARYNVRKAVSKRGRYRCRRNNTLMKFHLDVQTSSRSNWKVRRKSQTHTVEAATVTNGVSSHNL